MTIDAHETCTCDDIIEAIHTNFIGALEEIKYLDIDNLRNIVIEKQDKAWGERKFKDKLKNLQIFRVVVEKDEVARNIIEGWNDRFNFDNLAFQNAVYDQIKINVTGVQRLP